MEHNTIYEAPRRDLLPFVPRDARRVLDVGCGAGGFGRTLLSERPSTQIEGVEMVAAMAAQAREGGYSAVHEGLFPDAADALLDRSFDTILFFDVLEHMFDPPAALQAAERLLAPGGRVVASIPNVRHFAVWWPLLRHGRWDYQDSGLLDRTHIRWFTRDTMRELFEHNGWQVVRITGVNRTRSQDGAGVQDTPKIRAMSRMSGGRTDHFFYVQYVVEATRPGLI